MGILKIPISNNCTYSGRNFILPYFESSYFPKKKELYEIILQPVEVKLSSIVTSFFKYMKYVTTHDIDILNSIENQKFLINSKINFILITIFFVLLISIFSLVMFKRKSNKKNNNKVNNIEEEYITPLSPPAPSLPPSPPPLPPPPVSHIPPPFIYEDKINYNYIDMSGNNNN